MKSKTVKYMSNLNNERSIQFYPESKIKYHYSLKHCQNKSVLDIGCGLGFGSNYLANNGAKRILGIDHTKEAITFAQNHFKADNLEFLQLKAESLTDLPGKFDTILAFELIEHLSFKDGQNLIQTIKMSLKANGFFILSTPNKLLSSPNRSKPYNPYHLYEYTVVNLTQILNKYFKHVHICGLKPIHPQHQKYDDFIMHSWRGKFISYIYQWKVFHPLFSAIPKPIKKLFIQKPEIMDNLSVNDFKFYQTDLSTCPTLIAIAQ